MTLKLEHVSFGYIKQPLLLTDISLSKQSGCLFVFGQKGAGKTTFLELLCGMQTLYVGKISVQEKLPQQNTKNITYLPSCVVALNNKTVLQNLQYACEAINKDYACINLQDNWINLFKNTKFKKLSAYNKAIFALKRAEIKDAKLLLIDIDLNHFKQDEIVNYAKILQQIINQKNKLIVVSVNAEDYKKLQIELNDSEIYYIFATKIQKYNNWTQLQSSADYMGIAEYLPLKKHNAEVVCSNNGYLVKFGNKQLKINENYLKKIDMYFDEVTTTTKIAIFTNLDVNNITDSKFDVAIKNNQILIYDDLTTQRLI